MGWLWNIKVNGIDKVRDGWRPGAILKPIKQRMCAVLSPFPCDDMPLDRGRCLQRSARSRYLDIDSICRPCERKEMNIQVDQTQMNRWTTNPKDALRQHKFTMTNEIENENGKENELLVSVIPNKIGSRKGQKTLGKIEEKTDGKTELAKEKGKLRPITANEKKTNYTLKSGDVVQKHTNADADLKKSKIRPKTGIPKPIK